VATIRARRLAGEKQTSIAADYDLAQTTVSHICSGRLWSRDSGTVLNGKEIAKANRLENTNARKISSADVVAIQHLPPTG
jgi:hypothetical protein